MRIRPPAVAGQFYPGRVASLVETAAQLLDAVEVPAGDELGVAYVVPHAGWRYSGPIAAQVYARLRGHRDRIRRVVLIGPAHQVPLDGCALSGADRWQTPLGEVPLDQRTLDPEAVDRLRERFGERVIAVDDLAHAREHSLEVQVPFLQTVLGSGTRLLPICVGSTPQEQVAAVLTAAGCGEPGTVLLCSTDFSHYLPDAMAREQDRGTARHLLALAPDQIGPRDACGVFGLRGLLTWAGRQLENPRAELLALGTSADTAGSPDRVVGYPAFVVRGDGVRSQQVVPEVGQPV